MDRYRYAMSFYAGRAEANFRWEYPSKYQKFDFAKLTFIFEFLLYKTHKRWGYLGSPSSALPNYYVTLHRYIF